MPVTQLPRIVFVPADTTAHHATHTIYRVHGGDDDDARMLRNLPTVRLKAVIPACAE